MKLILLADVRSLGRKGEIVDVADGYARNYLLPRGLAGEASQGALATLQQQHRAKAKRTSEALAASHSLAELLQSRPVNIRAKCGEGGKLFGAVTNAQIADAIAKTFDVTIDRHKIEYGSSIKSVGSYPVEIKLAPNIVAKTTVTVEAA